MRTISATDSTSPDGATIIDLDGRVVDGLESLRQRIAQRLRFPRGTWFLDGNAGTDSVLGHQITAPLAGTVMTGAIREEGGDEVVAVEDVRVDLDHDTRELSYSARVVSVYGPFQVFATVI